MSFVQVIVEVLVWTVVLATGIAAFVMAFFKAVPKTPNDPLEWWAGSYFCLIIAVVIVLTKVYLRMKQAEGIHGLTVARKQTARNQLAVLGEAEKRFVRQLLLDDHLSSGQIRAWHSEEVLHNVHTHTSFLQHSPSVDRWSIDPAWHAILSELLIIQDSMFRRLWEWACRQSSGLQRIWEAMKDTHN